VSPKRAVLKGKKLDASLPNIKLKDIDKKEGGASVGGVIVKVMDVAGKAVGFLGIGEVTKSLGGLILVRPMRFKKSVSGATDSIEKGAEGAKRTLNFIC
jgi:hypothetical protein